MKKIATILASCIVATSLSLAVIACTADEQDDTNLSKEELLLKKSKEFAQKYDVDMALNEDSLSQIAETLTIEQMEEDYKEWAAMLKDTLHMQTKIIPQAVQTKNKLRVRRRISQEEASGRNGEFEGFGTFGNGRNAFDAQITVSWKFYDAARNSASAEVKVYGAKDGIPPTFSIDLHPSFSLSDPNGISWSGYGSIDVPYRSYYITVSVTASYNESANLSTIFIS